MSQKMMHAPSITSGAVVLVLELGSIVMGMMMLWGMHSASATPFNGVLQNFQINDILTSPFGWSVCHISPYNQQVNFTDVMANACNKRKLLFGCRAGVNPNTLITAARNYRETVLNNVGPGAQNFTESQGVYWYYSPSGPTVGFAPAGDRIDRNPTCSSETGYNRRLCWQLQGQSLTNQGRCGDFLNPSGTHERVILHADETNAPSQTPSTSIPSVSPSTSKPTNSPSVSPTKKPTSQAPTTVTPTGSPTVVPLDTFFGVGTNIDTNTQLLGGWTLCHLSAYDTAVNLSDMFSSECNKSRLLIGCASASSPAILIVAAQSPRSTVLLDVGKGEEAQTTTNGVAFYYNPDSSFGFGPEWDFVSRTPCDTTFGTEKLCWKTSEYEIVPGDGRCGDNLVAPGDDSYLRVVFQADEPTSYPSMSPVTAVPTDAPTSSTPTFAPATARPTTSPSRAPSSSPPTESPTRPSPIMFQGVSNNVDLGPLLDSGWSICHTSDYMASVKVSLILQMCDKKKLMFACRSLSNVNNLVLAAISNRDQTVVEQGTVAEGFVVSNDAKWHYSQNFCWGVGPTSDSVERSITCSGNMGHPKRLCWPTITGTVTLGGRCGDVINPSSGYERVLLHMDDPTSYPTRSPATSKPTPSPFTSRPTFSPTRTPSHTPTLSKPSATPNRLATNKPSRSPKTSKPTVSPTTSLPTTSPSKTPSRAPTRSPTSSKPSLSPSKTPTTSVPSSAPSSRPSTTPSSAPTLVGLVGLPSSIGAVVIVDEVSKLSVEFTAQYAVDVSIGVCEDGTQSWFRLSSNDFVSLNSAGAVGVFNFTLLLPNDGISTSLEASQITTGCFEIVAEANNKVVFQRTINVGVIISMRCQQGSISATGTNHPVPCSLCSRGTFSQALSSSTACDTCPENFPLTPSLGSTSLTMCEKCPLGFYCPVGDDPKPCPKNGGYEPVDGGQERDRDAEHCVAVECKPTFWCGPGAAENITYIESVQFTGIVGTTIIRQRKSFLLTFSNVREDSVEIEILSAVDEDQLWYSVNGYNANGLLVIPAGQSGTISVDVNSVLFSSDELNSTLPFIWRLAGSQDTFDLQVPVFIQVVSLIVSPLRFDYSVKEADSMGLLDPPIPTTIEVFNTLCNNSVTAYISPTDCDGAPLGTSAPWFSFENADPFAPQLIEQQTGVPLKIPFRLDRSKLVLSAFHPSHPNGTVPATYFRTCLSLELVLNGLDLSVYKQVNVSFRMLRPCPPGTSAISGTDSDGCTACPLDLYQQESGKAFCTKCPDDFPKTRGTGSNHPNACLVDKGGFRNQNGTKVICPVGADCSEVGVSIETLTIKSGYWRTNPQSDVILECPVPRYCAGGKMVTKTDEADEDDSGRRLSTGDPVGICLANHTGAFCYGCAAGYIKRTELKICSLCTNDDYIADSGKLTSIFLGVTIAAVLLVSFVFFYTNRSYRIEKGLSKRSLIEVRVNSMYEALDVSIILQIVIGFIQVVSGMSVTFRDILPIFFRQLRDVFATLALDLINVLDFGCTLSAQNHLTGLLISTLLPILVSFALLVVHVILEKILARKDEMLRMEMRNTSFTVFLVILFLVYPSCSNKILATFSCREFDDGSSTITSDPSVSCQDPVYLSYRVYAAFMVLVYPIGIPVFYSFLLFRERHKLNPFEKSQGLDAVAQAMRESNRDIRYLRFLWKPYKSRFFWFETFELLRKLAQTSIVVFVAPGSSPQIVFQLLTTVISVVVLNSLTPYTQRKHNLLAVLAQWAIFGIALVTLLIKFNRNSTTVVTTYEYDPTSLDNLMVLLFFCVPVAALALVSIQILSARRELFFCLNWDSIERRYPRLERSVARISTAFESSVVKKRSDQQFHQVVVPGAQDHISADNESAIFTREQTSARNFISGTATANVASDSVAQHSKMDMAARTKRQSVIHLAMLKHQARPDNHALPVEAKDIITKMEAAFDLVTVELESEVRQQIARGDILLDERDNLARHVRVLEDQLKAALLAQDRGTAASSSNNHGRSTIVVGSRSGDAQHHRGPKGSFTEQLDKRTGAFDVKDNNKA